jgi:hypothetical protein
VRGVPGTEVAPLRVVKRLAVSSRGAIKLARQFGDDLVCVRHRVDPEGRFRYTTVELLVDRAPIQPRVETMVAVRIDGKDRALQRVVKAAGAKWDFTTRLWRMPKRVAGILRLTSRIADK